jgi:hypothetical protein
MEPRDFCYWLKGYLELEKPIWLDTPRLRIVSDHLELVFNKVTPDRTKEASYCGSATAVDELGYQKLFTAHTGITAKGLC